MLAFWLFLFVIACGAALWAYGASLPTKEDKEADRRAARDYYENSVGEVVDVRLAKPNGKFYCEHNYPMDDTVEMFKLVEPKKGKDYWNKANSDKRWFKRTNEQTQCNYFYYGRGPVDVSYWNNSDTRGRVDAIYMHEMKDMDNKCNANTIACTYCETQQRDQVHGCVIYIYAPLTLLDTPDILDSQRMMDHLVWMNILDHEYKHVFIGDKHVNQVEEAAPSS